MLEEARFLSSEELTDMDRHHVLINLYLLARNDLKLQLWFSLLPFAVTYYYIKRLFVKLRAMFK